MGATQRVFVGLDVEWALVCATPANGALVRGWIEEACVAAAGELSQELRELVAYLAGRRDAAFSDRWLIALLDRAAGEGQEAQLAARVIVQAMVPGMVRLTQSLLTRGATSTTWRRWWSAVCTSSRGPSCCAVGRRSPRT